MTPPISWPLALLLSVVTVSLSALVWKGAIPSHSLFAIVGAIVGYLLNTTIATLRTKRDSFFSKTSSSSPQEASSSDVDITKDFSVDEVATKSELKSIPPK